LRLGIYGGALYAFVQVHANSVRYEIPGSDDRPVKVAGDRVLLMTRDLSGVERAWSISAVAPGPVIVRRTNTSPPWKSTVSEEPDIRGTWRATRDGFDVELRIPQRLIGAELAIDHVDDALLPDTFPCERCEPLRKHCATSCRCITGRVRIAAIDSQGWLLARLDR